MIIATQLTHPSGRPLCFTVTWDRKTTVHTSVAPGLLGRAWLYRDIFFEIEAGLRPTAWGQERVNRTARGLAHAWRIGYVARSGGSETSRWRNGGGTWPGG